MPGLESVYRTPFNVPFSVDGPHGVLLNDRGPQSLGVDTDPDFGSDTESFGGATVDWNGSGGAFTYIPNPDVPFTGIDTFTYSILTSSEDFDFAEVSVEVDPIVTNDAYGTPFNTPLVVSDLGVRTNDQGAGGIASWDLLSAHGGSISMGDDGGFVYIPPFNFSGTDTFNYVVDDINIDNTFPASVTVNVGPGVPVSTTTTTTSTTTTTTTTSTTTTTTTTTTTLPPTTTTATTAPTTTSTTNALPPPTARTVSIGDALMLEGETGVRKATFKVSLSQAAEQTVSVRYAVVGMNATAAARRAPGVDVKATTGLLKFKSGISTRAVSVPVYGDANAEANETYAVILSSPSPGGVLGRAVGVGAILDDDPGTRALGIGDASVARVASGREALVLPVTLSAAAPSSFVVSYVITPGSATYNATGGADFGGALTGTLMFGRSTWLKNISVPLWPKSGLQGARTFTVTITGVAPSMSVRRSVGRGTILDL